MEVQMRLYENDIQTNIGSRMLHERRKNWMWAEQIVLGLIGLSSGVAVAADYLHTYRRTWSSSRFILTWTHTAENLLLYEDSIALGGILGNACLFSDQDSRCRLCSSLFRRAVRHICRMLSNGIGRNPECISDFLSGE